MAIIVTIAYCATHFVPGTRLSTLHILSHLILTIIFNIDVNSLIFYMGGKWGSESFRELAQVTPLVHVQGPQMASEGHEIPTGV